MGGTRNQGHFDLVPGQGTSDPRISNADWTISQSRIFRSTPTAIPVEDLVFTAVRAPLTLPTFASVGRQGHGVATPRAPPPGGSFKEGLLAAIRTHLSCHGCEHPSRVCLYVRVYMYVIGSRPSSSETAGNGVTWSAVDGRSPPARTGRRPVLTRQPRPRHQRSSPPRDINALGWRR